MYICETMSAGWIQTNSPELLIKVLVEMATTYSRTGHTSFISFCKSYMLYVIEPNTTIVQLTCCNYIGTMLYTSTE